MPSAWYRRPGVWCALGVLMTALAVYTRTLPPTISFWDCGEYITTAHILGIPHQPGTPLYVLMGRCFDLVIGLFGVSTAVAVNFMSAFFSAVGLMLLYLIVADLARRADPDSGWLAHAGGVIGALFLLFSDTYWNNAIEAEVYGLAGFIVALLTWLSLRWYDARQEARSDRILYLILYLLGLGVGFHLGSLLVYPAVFVLVLVAREHRLPLGDLVLVSLGLALFLLSTMVKDDTALILLLLGYILAIAVRAMQGRPFALIGSALFVLGLSVHLYMLIRAAHDPAINQSAPDNFATLMSVLRREQYPPINVFERSAPLGWQFGYYYDFLLRQFTYLPAKGGALGSLSVFAGPIFLGLLGLLHGLRRLRPWIWLLVAGYLINADGLTLYLNFTDHEVRERDYFYGTGFLYFAILIGLGAAALLRYAAGREGPSARDLPPDARPTPVRAGPLAVAAAALLIAIPALPALVPGHVKWFEHDRSDNWIAREYVLNMLAGLDRDAILFTNGDNDTFPIWYLQEVEHYRRDVTVVNLMLINLPWYIKQLKSRSPALPLSYTDAEIDRLQPRLIEDRSTGQRQIFYVRDYVLHDCLTTNARNASPRPVFFAVTIPQENMARYYPYLQMEGLAFRLTGELGAEGQPRTDTRRLLDNMLGLYDYRGILDGDSGARQQRFRQQGGRGPLESATGRTEAPDLSRAELVALMGEMRTDVYRDANTRNLLGNYPAAAIRAGYDFLTAAQQVPGDDTLTYDRLIDQAALGLDMARRFEPLYPPLMDIFPMVAVEQGRVEEAMAYLEFLRPRLTGVDWEAIAYRPLLMLGGSGRIAAALAFLDDVVTARPDELSGYRLAFNVNRALGRLEACREVTARWRAQNGRDDPDLARALAAFEAEAGGGGAAPQAPSGQPGGEAGR